MSVVPFGEIVEIRKGKKPTRVVDLTEAGSHPCILIDELRGKTPTVFTLDKNGVEARADDMCIVWDGANAGTVGFGVEGYLGSTIARLRIKNRERWDTRFLGRLLQGQFSAINTAAHGKGATIPHVDKRHLEELQLPTYPLEEQKRIAVILEQADELRRKRQHAIDRLNQLGEAIFHEMFGDPKTNPHGFPTIALGDLIKVSSGSGLIAADQKGGDYPVYGGNGVNGWHNDFTVPAGTIVIGRVGVYCGAVHVTDRSAWVTDNALIVSLKRPVNPTYLATALKIANLNQYAGRSAQPLVSGSRIYPIEILDPPTGKQDLYESKIRQFTATSNEYAAARRALNSLFSALQHRAFKGEL